MSKPVLLSLRSAIIATGLMLAASSLAYGIRPTERVADNAARFDLSTMVPVQFGEWREELLSMAQVVNPQQQAMLDKLYRQMLTRTYVNARGERIMLSIAYGGDQTDSNQVHEPENCYPAQGFQLQRSIVGELDSGHGRIPVKRIVATLGARHEPVTYWILVGRRAVHPGLDKKIEEMRYGLRGQIPDGMLFRISSIDRNETAAFEMQDRFVRELIESMSPAARQRIAGLG